jgi:hypothetical protein
MIARTRRGAFAGAGFFGGRGCLLDHVGSKVQLNSKCQLYFTLKFRPASRGAAVRGTGLRLWPFPRLACSPPGGLAFTPPAYMPFPNRFWTAAALGGCRGRQNLCKKPRGTNTNVTDTS